MSVVRANNYFDASGGSNAVFSGVASPPNSMGFRNRILNGNMVIDQRNAGASQAVTTSNVYCVDRWGVRASTGSGHTVQQTTTAPVGFINSLRFTTGTGASPAAGDVNWLLQQIEGLNVADFGWGTANAVSITVGFWVRSSLTGTFGGAIQNNANNRSYPFTYTISAANTFEFKTVTVPGDTSGTWLTNNAAGIFLYLSMGMGSTYRGTAGVWASADYRGATGETNVVGTSGATFFLTGVQLEAGSVATPFERRDYGRELMMCQRYYQKSYNTDVAPGTNTTTGAKTSRVYSTDTFLPQMETRLLVSMRASPTVTWYTTSGTSGSINVGGGTNTVNTQYDTAMNSTGWLLVNGSVSSGSQITGQFAASAEL
jgi:hypothetical protein